MSIETLSNNNIDALVELVLELWKGCSLDEELESYKSIIDSANEICFLAKVEGTYIAFVHISIRNDYVEGADEPPIAYVEGIYVKPKFQKRGVAKRLMSVAEDWARQKGLRQIASDTEITNSVSVDFHKKNGFAEVERIVCFIKDLP